MKKSTVIVSLSVLAIGAILILACGILLWQNHSLGTRISALEQSQSELAANLEKSQADYASLQSKYSSSQASLAQSQREIAGANENIANLSSVLLQKERLLNESLQNLSSQKAKAEEIATALSSLQSSINESMGWFRDNAALPSDLNNANVFLNRAKQDCVDGAELNVACMSYLMENTAFSIHYRTDTDSSGKLDFLQSVAQTINSGWGDCEDYSLIFKAELNSLRASLPASELVAWTPGGTQQFRVYPKESTPASELGAYWYVPNSRKVMLGELGKLHAYVVCYKATSNFGHCTVALSENELTESSQVRLLIGAEVFEPQTGQYLGSVGTHFSICSDAACHDNVNDIQLIISDSDLYKFEGNEWVGYSDYAVKVADAKEGLSG